MWSIWSGRVHVLLATGASGFVVLENAMHFSMASHAAVHPVQSRQTIPRLPPTICSDLPAIRYLKFGD